MEFTLFIIVFLVSYVIVYITNTYLHKQQENYTNDKYSNDYKYCKVQNKNNTLNGIIGNVINIPFYKQINYDNTWYYEEDDVIFNEFMKKGFNDNTLSKESKENILKAPPSKSFVSHMTNSHKTELTNSIEEWLNTNSTLSSKIHIVDTNHMSIYTHNSNEYYRVYILTHRLNKNHGKIIDVVINNKTKKIISAVVIGNVNEYDIYNYLNKNSPTGFLEYKNITSRFRNVDDEKILKLDPEKDKYNINHLLCEHSKNYILFKDDSILTNECHH